ncbi:NAD(P)/FAD-dependent oxidoreductase [Thiolapillus sp.]
MKTNTSAPQEETDVLIIGGGPAGSTLSTLLAQQGHRVILLEMGQHPRFHIGESLLPMTLPILERLGVSDKIQQISIHKYGAEFNAPEGEKRRETFYFDFALDKNHPYAYEIHRPEFDQILFENAQDKGVDAREGIKVTGVSFDKDGSAQVTAQNRAGESLQFRARFLVDASGRETFLSRRFKLKQKSRKHNSAAIFGHFDNVERRPGKDEGNISIYWFKHGWFWMIPLKGGRMSVGAVCYPEYLKTRSGSTESFLQQTIDMVPEIRQRMKDAVLTGEVRATGNFSYTSSRMYGPPGENWLLVGDAYAFIDPVFSSGIHIAMSGAVKAAESIDQCLQEPHTCRQALQQYQQHVDAALKTFSWLIHRFNSPAIRKLFMAPSNQWRIQESLISLLAGDLYRDTPVQKGLNIFKIIYYLTFIRNLPSAWATHRRRKRNIRLHFSGGTTEQDHLDD